MDRRDRSIVETGCPVGSRRRAETRRAGASDFARGGVTPMRKRTVVGVTINEGWVRGVQIDDGRPPLAGEVELADDVVLEGIVVDTQALAAALRTLWAAAGFTSKRVAIAVETDAATIRRVCLPPLADDEIGEAAAYEIADVLGYPAAEAVISHAVLTTTPDSVEALVVAVREELIARLAEASRSAGLTWVRAELAAAALIASTETSEEVERSPEALRAVVSIGETTTTVAVHDDRGVLFARVLMTGVGDAALLSHELEHQLAELEHLRAGREAVADGVVSVGDAAPGVSVVAEGIRRTLHYYSSDIDARPISRLLLAGPRSRSAGLSTQVASAMPATTVSLVEHRGWDEVEQPERFDTARGVACLARTESTLGRNLCLVPESARRRERDRRALSLGAVVAMLLLVLAVGDGWRRSSALAAEERMLAATEGTGDRLRTEIVELADVRRMASEVGDRREVIAEIADGDVAVVAVLGRIAQAMPPDSFVLAMRIERTVAGGDAPDGQLASITVDAAAPDLDGVGRWIQAVSTVAAVEDLTLGQTVYGPYDANEQMIALFDVEAA